MLSFFSRLLSGVDAILHRSAALLGAATRNKHRRRFYFLAGNALLCTLALLAAPPVAIGLLVLNLWLLAAVYWTWVCNEHTRSRIAKKIDRTDPDSFPRLADLALLTAAVTPLVMLLLFDQLQRTAGLFAVKQPVGLLDWFWFVLDKTYLRALPDTLDLWITRVEGIHAGRVNYFEGGEGLAGRLLVLFAWAMLYTILLQGLLRWWQVWRDISDAIAGVAEDPDMAVRLGRRAGRPLLRAWHEPDLPVKTRANIARALGRIRHPAAIPVLEQAAQDVNADPEVRTASLLAIGQIGGVRAATILGRILLRHENEEIASVRAAAAQALGHLSDPAATPPLLEKLRLVQLADRRKMDHPEVRKSVVQALGEHLVRRRSRAGDDPAADCARAVVLILCGEGQRSLLQDAYLRVRNRAATALSYLPDPRSLAPLTLLVQENENPKLLQSGTEALGRLLGALPEPIRTGPEGRAAIEELLRRLRDSENDSVLESTVRGLGYARAAEATDLLWTLFEQALRSDQEGLSAAADMALRSIDPGHGERIDRLERQVGREHSQRRRLTVLGEMFALEDRLRAARELGEYRDRRGRQALGRVADNEAAPPELRQVCRDSLALIRAAPRT